MLLPQSPLIHFQWDQPGAALRATEVKPKLDRYIIKRYRKENGTEIPKQWLIEQPSKDKTAEKKPALKYRMRITAQNQNAPIILGTIKVPITRRDGSVGYKRQATPYDIYYGNTGDENDKKGIMREHRLEIQCFVSGLFETIKNYIREFFIVTNFGTMQSKGFGSFVIDDTDTKPRSICKVLMKEYGADTCYWFEASKGAVFKQIKTVYSLMKSGINLSVTDKSDKTKRNQIAYCRSLLFDYFHSENKNAKGDDYFIGNEKAWMKRKGIAPITGKHKYHPNESNAPERYVRALLGIGETLQFIPENFSTRDKDKIVVKYGHTEKDKEKKIDRLPSPILFKVINNKVYFLATKINPIIFDKEFRFSSSRNKDTIRTPKKNEVRDNFLEDFLDYVYYVLQDCNEKEQFREIRETNFKKESSEVKKHGK